jgi:hypothetical protein
MVPSRPGERHILQDYSPEDFRVTEALACVKNFYTRDPAIGSVIHRNSFCDVLGSHTGFNESDIERVRLAIVANGHGSNFLF